MPSNVLPLDGSKGESDCMCLVVEIYFELSFVSSMEVACVTMSELRCILVLSYNLFFLSTPSPLPTPGWLGKWRA